MSLFSFDLFFVFVFMFILGTEVGEQRVIEEKE